jgi:hypothetical protein
VPAAVSRRALLAAALAAAGSAACTSSGSTPPPPLPSPTPPTKEQLTRMAAVAREKELGRLARAALDANPGMAGARSTLSFSGQHVQALSETLVPSDSTSSHAAGSQTGSSARSQNLASRAASARTLASALLHAAAAHRAAATSADSDLARLLVSVAASDSALAAGLQRGGA